jgi:hypothetical protein
MSRRCRKLSGMSDNDHPAKGKSQAHPVGFRGNERIKDIFRLIWVDPGARILDRHDDFIAAGLAADLQNPMFAFVKSAIVQAYFFEATVQQIRMGPLLNGQPGAKL